MSFIGLGKIELMNLNSPIKKVVEESKKAEQQKILQTIKDTKINKQKEKLESEENYLLLIEKKERAIKKTISMINNKKDKNDIVKKLGNILDKYYIKKYELEY
jgi:hypothetical protein